jgi:hypothetical protein
MELWIRSTAKTNLLQARFLTIMEGKTFYKKNEWEYEGYTICNVALNGNYELLGTYKTKERAIEVLNEIQYKIKNMYILENCKLPKDSCIEQSLAMDNFNIYEMPEK